MDLFLSMSLNILLTWVADWPNQYLVVWTFWLLLN